MQLTVSIKGMPIAGVILPCVGYSFLMHLLEGPAMIAWCHSPECAVDNPALAETLDSCDQYLHGMSLYRSGDVFWSWCLYQHAIFNRAQACCSMKLAC